MCVAERGVEVAYKATRHFRDVYSIPPTAYEPPHHLRDVHPRAPATGHTCSLEHVSLEWRAASYAPAVQGYLTYKKPHHPRTLPYAYVYGRRGVLRGWVFSHGGGIPVKIEIETEKDT